MTYVSHHSRNWIPFIFGEENRITVSIDIVKWVTLVCSKHEIAFVCKCIDLANDTVILPTRHFELNLLVDFLKI